MTSAEFVVRMFAEAAVDDSVAEDDAEAEADAAIEVNLGAFVAEADARADIEAKAKDALLVEVPLLNVVLVAIATETASMFPIIPQKPVKVSIAA